MPIGLGIAACSGPGMLPPSSAPATAVPHGAEAGAGTPRTSFLGNASVLIRDAETALLIDGFFSRPPWWKLAFGRVDPDAEAIRRALGRADAPRLDAVLVSHSHYDHAMDAPALARITGARVLGSATTAKIALGGGLGSERICVIGSDAGDARARVGSSGSCVRPRQGEPCRATETAPLCIGDFQIRFVPSEHGRGRFDWAFPEGPKRLTEPLVPPARFTAYPRGPVYSIHVSHPKGKILVHPSAGFRPGALKPYEADRVFLGVALLGEQPRPYIERYYAETVRATGANEVVPIHWDDFTRSLDKPLQPLPDLLTDLSRAMRVLRELVAQDPGTSLVALPAFTPLPL